jgi:hypothetical protein
LSIKRGTSKIEGRAPGKVGAYVITTWTQLGGVKSNIKTQLLLVEAFPSAFVGRFESLLENADGLPSGKVAINVATNASLTGVVYYGDGRNYSFSGVLAIEEDDGSARGVLASGADIVLKRKAPLLPLTLELKFVPLSEDTTIDNGVELTVNVSEEVSPGVFEESTGSAIELFTFTKAAPAPWADSKAKNVTLSDVSGTPFFTASAGTGTFAVASNGILSVKIRGSDGATITGSAASSTASDYRLYSRPYSKTPMGYFAGWFKAAEALTITDATYPTSENEIYWLRPAGGTGNFSAGFGPLSIELVTP